jgi:hypothetical protein
MREGAAVFSKEKLPGRDMTSTPIPFYWPNGWSRTSREQPGGASKLQWLGGPHEPLSEVR